jgi:dolichyl-phosphate beta-glucosyltransferase
VNASATWVVPCYNEGDRLDGGAFRSLVDSEPGLSLLFVDDGSRDHTRARLAELARERDGCIHVLSLPLNQGKAEAVRQGLRDALGRGAHVVGYLDADLATPVAEARRLLRVLRERDVDVVLASRVALLGRTIERRAARHYSGRVFATLASMALGLPVYDTQCGAKLFRRTPALEAALGEPFLSRLAFDVELVGRLLVGAPGAPGLEPSRIVEEPLLVWRDVPGSKLHLAHMLRAAADVGRIAWDLRARRRA